MEDSAAISSKLKQRWPSTSNKSEWRNWVARLKSSPFSDNWKHAGIYDAIIISTNKIRLDSSLLTAGLSFWNSTTNTMDLPNLGMMSPTLFDVAAITGFRPHGKEVSALTIPSPKRLNLNGVDMIYSKFIRHFMGKNDQQVTVEEHIAFLLYWLCKYVFCVAACKIIKEWAGLAEALALYDDETKEPFALGQIMLAHLYRGLQQDGSGPLWLFQMWLQLYFPELAPCDVTYHQDQILGASLAASTTSPEHTFETCFKLLHRCTSRTDEQWSVCLNRDYPSFLKLFWQSSSSEEAAHNSIRASILTTRDIHFGVKVGSVCKTSIHNYICAAELYCPDHFARQLGCMQCIPERVISSVNEYSSSRHRFVMLSEVKELSNKAKSLLMKFKDQPRNKTFECSVGFVTWWNEKMEKSSVEVKHERQEFVPSSSSDSVRELKRMRSNGTPNPGIEVINLDDEDEDEDEDEDDEMTLEDYRLMKRNKNMENQDLPSGFEQATSPLSVQENTNASFPQQLNDMEDFVKFKTTIQELMNTRSLPSMEITVLQDQLSDVESHLPKFIASKEDLVGADKNLKRWLNLLPGATSKLETVDHRCSELDDQVKQLGSTLADFETKTAQVRLQHAQKVAELKTEREMRAQIQQIVDKINQYEETKKKLESDMGRTREMYDLLLKRALDLA